jgi:hypothetical protein
VATLEKQIGSQTRAEGRGHGFRDVLNTRRRHARRTFVWFVERDEVLSLTAADPA